MRMRSKRITPRSRVEVLQRTLGEPGGGWLAGSQSALMRYYVPTSFSTSNQCCKEELVCISFLCRAEQQALMFPSSFCLVPRKSPPSGVAHYVVFLY